ncbi:hypothetical protein [Thiococcus pfennigii]|uniref:hypothetical protein n=1 Tax=Thiococcus pfennigii TaxID=1057 RepID=UPI0019056F15|nr:hypothetical protein [Thiococcus pfennigii]
MSDTMPSPRAPHWLYRRENLPNLWLIQIAILVLALLPEFFVHHHAHFPGQGMTLDASWGFYAWYGFTTCAGMVALAKVMGIFLKRPDHYYDDRDDGVRDD